MGSRKRRHVDVVIHTENPIKAEDDTVILTQATHESVNSNVEKSVQIWLDEEAPYGEGSSVISSGPSGCYDGVIKTN